MQTAIKNYENLHEAAGAVFFTYLHRLHHYATTRNPKAAELTREPFGASVAQNVGRASARPGRAEARPTSASVTIEDPLTTMQFRALDWIFRHETHLAEKRARVQAMRKRSDREIFERFPLHIVPTYPGDETLASSALFRLLRSELPTVERKLDEILKP